MLGGGSWASALTKILSENGARVDWWLRSKDDVQHLLRTWHPDTRPENLELDPDLRWYRLDIHATTGGGPFEEWGTVDFTAHYRPMPGTDAPRGSQHENSRFRRVDGQWLYLDGAVHSA